MKAFDTNPRLRWLFCFTHPDDEVSICAWIRRLVRQGNEVHLAWTHSTPIREAEARAVAHILGVRPANLHFFGATDGGVAEEMVSLLPRFEKLMREVAPDRVCCLSFEQGHIDHDATNLLVAQTFDGPICEVPIYSTYATKLLRVNSFADPRGQEVLHLTRDERRLKLVVAKQYPSQRIWSALQFYRAFNTIRLRPKELIGLERMRVQCELNYLKPNLPPRRANRVRKTETWKRWKRAVRALNKAAQKPTPERELISA